MLTRYSPDEPTSSAPEMPSDLVWAQEQLNQKVFGTITEAAQMVGKHRNTIRRLIENSTPSIVYRVTDGGTIVYIPSVFQHYHKDFPYGKPNAR